MRNRVKCCVYLAAIGLAIVAFGNMASAEDGRPFYYMGCFAYEEESFTEAEIYLLQALRREPDNAMYHHYLGKTYLKTGQYDKSEEHLRKAEQLNPEILELGFDLGMLAYRTGKFEKALTFFNDAAKKNPKEVYAVYYAGMSAFYLGQCEESRKYFEKAYTISPSLRKDCEHILEVCHEKTGKYSSDAQTSSSREPRKAPKSYALSIKILRSYDDNVPLDSDNREIYSDKSDGGTEATLSGKYEFFRKDNYAAGAGIFHHQVRYDNLGDYDRSATVLEMYASYTLAPFRFKLSYLPSYYFSDSESSLRQHSVSPEIIWVFHKDMGVKFRYVFSSNHDFSDWSGDGNSDEFSADIYYRLPRMGTTMFMGAGYKDNTADNSDKNYHRLTAKIGFFTYLPWDMKMVLYGEYEDTRYDDIDSYYKVTRDDDGYSAYLSLSKQVFYDWLNMIVEYEYGNRDSVILPMEYTRNRISLGLEAKF